MHRWSLPTSNGQTYLMLKATAVLSYPAQMAAAMKHCFNLHALAARRHR